MMLAVVVVVVAVTAAVLYISVGHSQKENLVGEFSHSGFADSIALRRSSFGLKSFLSIKK